MAQLNSEIKTAIKNTLLHFSDNNLDFNPQNFLDILCAECRNMGVKFSECDWFSAWSGRFEGAIKKELQNSPIKTRDDFIDKIAQICNHKRESIELADKSNATKTLQKALTLLKAHKIIDFNANLPLNAIDSKLSALLESNKSLESTKSNESTKSAESNKSLESHESTELRESTESHKKISHFLAHLGAQHIKIDKNQKILLCKFSEQTFIKTLDSHAHSRLLHSFCALLLNNLSSQNVIGIYKNAVAIFSKERIDALKSEIEKILEIHTFMLHNKPLRLKIDFVVVKFGELQ